MQNKNLLFYLNKIKSEPDGDYIDMIHKKWWKDYDLLDEHPNFIQWLFPNSNKSKFNSHSETLTPEETDHFINNP